MEELNPQRRSDEAQPPLLRAMRLQVEERGRQHLSFDVVDAPRIARILKEARVVETDAEERGNRSGGIS